MSYNSSEILKKPVIDSADVLEIFDKVIAKNRDAIYPGLSQEQFAKVFKVSLTTIKKLSRDNYSSLGLKTAVRIAQNTLSATVCTRLSFDEKRIFRRFLRQYRASFNSNTDNINDDSYDPFEHQLLVNEFVNKFSNTREIVELLCYMFTSRGLSKNKHLSKVQAIALDELLAFEYVYETGWETYKMNSDYESEFKLHPSLIRSLWEVSFDHAESYLRREEKIINEISQNEVLETDLPEIEEALMKAKKTFNKCVEKGRGTDKGKVSVFFGRLFCELGE